MCGQHLERSNREHASSIRHSFIHITNAAAFKLPDPFLIAFFNPRSAFYKPKLSVSRFWSIRTLALLIISEFQADFKWRICSQRLDFT